MTKSFDDYMNDPRIKNEPMGLRITHAMRFKVQDETKDMTAKERNDLWLELEAKYRPHVKNKDFPYYGEGRRWQSQIHIYEVPFYYIDYCLAQIVALSYWAISQADHAGAWEKYRRFLGFAGTKTFVELVTDAGLPTPFEADNIKIVSDAAVKWLDS